MHDQGHAKQSMDICPKHPTILGQTKKGQKDKEKRHTCDNTNKRPRFTTDKCEFYEISGHIAKAN